MNKLFRDVVPSFILLLGATIFAQVAQSDHHEMMETSPVFESFRCDYNSGQDSGDLDKAVSFWQSQVEKIDSPDLKNYFAAVIKPLRSNNDKDFYWLGAYQNLNAFARGTAAYVASAEGQAADANFAKVSTCTSNLFYSDMIYGGTPPQEGNNEFVLEAYSCNLKKGKTMVNVMAVEQNFVAAAKAVKSPMNVYRLSPLLSGLGADVVYLVGHDDLVAFGSSNTTIGASQAGQTNQFMFSTVMDCSAGLYAGEVVQAGAPPE